MTSAPRKFSPRSRGSASARAAWSPTTSSRSWRVSAKRGLGLIEQGGETMVWGKGAVANGFVFLSGAEARSDDTDEPVEGVAAQTDLALERIKQRLREAGSSLEEVVKFVWYLRDR